MCLVALALKRKCSYVCLVDKAPLVLAGKFSCVLAGNVPTCAWCFGVHTKNIGGGVISTEVYPMIVEGAAIYLVSSEGGVIVVHTKQLRTRKNRTTTRT